MAVFVLSAIIFGLVMAIMAVGVLSGRSPIKGSCGGLGAVGVDSACEICGGDPQRCDEETDKANPEVGGETPFYRADR